MQTYLSVSKEDLQFNAAALTDYIDVPVIAVVKCNGYGIGLENAVNAWYCAGVRFFAAAEPFEVLQIADMGFDDVQILLTSPCFDEETLINLAQRNIIFTVTSVACANKLVSIKKDDMPSVKAHVKIDTGMGRFGQSFRDIDAIKDIYAVSGIDFCGIFSHFALSFEEKYDKTKIQLDRFLSVTNELKNAGIELGTRHIANSCAALLYPETRLDAVRIGSALVGRLMKPCPLALKKIGRLYAEVADTVLLKKGDSSGYAMIYKAKKDTAAAVVELGFRHGFGLTRKSDTFRFVDVLRDILHAVKGFNHPDFVTDSSGKTHAVIGRIGNQYTLFDNADNSLCPGELVSTDINVLLVDSAVKRILE